MTLYKKKICDIEQPLFMNNEKKSQSARYR